jgi:hypothetical protein
MKQIDLSQKTISELYFTGIQNFKKTDFVPDKNKKSSNHVFLELGISVI